MKIRSIAVCVALTLVAAACGSRLSQAKLAAGAGSGGGAGAGVVVATGGNTKGVSKGPTGPHIGTLPLPCGAAPAGAPAAATSSTAPGVTADKIRIAVISDKSGAIKVPTGSIEESAQAFVDFCNSYGGINGRKLDLLKIDAKLFSHLEATTAACNAGVFALVSSGSVNDNQGAQKMIDCGLIEVPAYTATAAKALSDNLVQPVPNPSNKFNAGAARFVAKLHPQAIKKAAILWGDLEVAKVQADRVVAAYEAQGFHFIYKKATSVVPTDYTSEAKAMKDAGVQYVTQVDSVTNTVKLLRDMQLQQFTPEVIDLGAQYYDPEIPKSSGSEGALVQLNTVPFEDQAKSPALQAYLDAYGKIDSHGIKPTTLGVQAFSAGLLFATAVKAAGNDVTRDRVLAELHKIKAWDGGGLQFLADPGDNRVNDCFLYMQVKNGAFVRFEPKTSGFNCDPSYRVDLPGNFGSGAKRKGS
ncbi:MAG: hypothetical protein JWN46_3036 [Acidimicrobiales bacterium]|nr:hypothetical protein [Acidimicrobiales bacterium]